MFPADGNTKATPVGAHRANAGRKRTYDKRKQEAPDGEESTRVAHIMERHRRLYQPLASADGGSELVAHRKDSQPFSRRPVVHLVRHTLDLFVRSKKGRERKSESEWERERRRVIVRTYLRGETKLHLKCCFVQSTFLLFSYTSRLPPPSPQKLEISTWRSLRLENSPGRASAAVR